MLSEAEEAAEKQRNKSKRQKAIARNRRRRLSGKFKKPLRQLKNTSSVGRRVETRPDRRATKWRNRWRACSGGGQIDEDLYEELQMRANYQRHGHGSHRIPDERRARPRQPQRRAERRRQRIAHGALKRSPSQRPD